jgi:hypothetical protein
VRGVGADARDGEEVRKLVQPTRGQLRSHGPEANATTARPR